MNDDLRKIIWLEKLIMKYNLDLSGLTVFTEYATGNYLYGGIASAFAGADLTLLYNPDIMTSDVKKVMKAFYQCSQFNPKTNDFFNKIGVVRHRDGIRKADIICNSGFVRPINRDDAEQMKETAVVALMMKTGQQRKEDVDIDVIRSFGRCIIGTHEEGIGLLSSIGYKALKACFEAGLSVWNDRFLLMGSGFAGDAIRRVFNQSRIDYQQYRSTEEIRGDIDAIIVADYNYEQCQIGAGGLLSIDDIKRNFPQAKVIHIAGRIDTWGLMNKGIDVFPQPSIYPNFSLNPLTGNYLSYKVTLELIVASLKAAELVARKRLEGYSVQEAEAFAVQNGPAQFC